MPNRQLPEALVRAAIQSPADGPDADLLGRFVTTRDAGAFAELVRRHGPMVLGVCRRALGNTPDADDAFQAVWLVLVRKATSVSPRGAVGNWLYGVASRTATHARCAIARRRAAQRDLPDLPDPQPPDPHAGELAAILDAELAHLPDKYRAAVVLCELEGRSLQETADQLGVPLGTVASRLARGRALLAERLKAKGFAAALLAGVLTTATVPVSARQTDLVTALVTAAPQEVARPVSELTRGVLNAMLAHKLKVTAQVVAVLALAVGAVAWVAAGAPQEPPAKEPPVTGLPIQPWEHGANKMNMVRGEADAGERLWADLYRDEPPALRAALDLAASPKMTIPLFQKNLKPLKTDKAEVKKWIADLGSEKEAEWKPAYVALDYYEPVLVMPPDEAWAEARSHRAQHRLAALLTGQPSVMGVIDPVRENPSDLNVVRRGDGFRVVIWSENPFRKPFDPPARGPGRGAGDKEASEYPVATRVTDVRRPAWVRAVRAIVILDHIGTPDALAILKEMAGGHPDAPPTVLAKEAVARRNAPAP